MKIRLHKNGVALILTISLLTALSILGISFVTLLTYDTKNARRVLSSWTSQNALDAAIETGIREIEGLLNASANYFASTIETGDPADAGIPVSPLYFKTMIRATNARLNLYRAQKSPETAAVFDKLVEELDLAASVKDDFRTLFRTLRIYHADWDLEAVSDLTKIDVTGIGDATKAKAYAQLAPHVTIFPRTEEELAVNILDYGRCQSVSGTSFEAYDRNFIPTGDKFALRGAEIEIIAGPAKGETNTVLEADPADPQGDKLVLEHNWSTAPTTDSFYRMTSRVAPINFNAASVELIEANLRVLEPMLDYIFAETGAAGFKNIGTYSSGGTTFLATLYNIRVNGVPSPVITDFFDYKQKFIDSIIGLDSLWYPVRTESVYRLFDLNEPKGIYDSTNNLWRIYPPVIPFVFRHRGYFDMEVEAGLKNHLTAKKANVTEKRFVTVRVGGSREQALREDFEAARYQRWMSSTDWVPVRTLRDFSGWDRVSTANFQPYVDTSANTTFNVIPDAIKTGLWLDFLADASGRGTDKVFSQITSSLENADNIYSPFFRAISGTAALYSSGLQIGGVAGDEPASELLLGTTGGSEYLFGQMSVMLELKDDTPLEDPFAHPPDNADWYSYQDGRTYADHKYVDHKAGTYPPELYFTPTVFLRDDGSDSVDIRAKTQFTINTGEVNPTNTCLDDPPQPQYADDAEVTVSLESDYAGRYYYGDGSHDYHDDYRLYTATLNNGTNDYLWLRFLSGATDINQTNFTNGSTDPEVNPFTVNASGRFGLKRLFPADPANPGTSYFPGDDNRDYTLRYLRLTAGVEGANHPHWTSKIYTLPAASTYATARVHYKIGLREDATNLKPDNFNTAFRVNTTPPDNVQIRMRFEFDMNPDADYLNFASDATATQDVDITGYDETTGFKDFPLNLSVGGTPANLNFSYRVSLENDRVSDAETLHSFLASTFAVTRVEIFYRTEPEVLTVLEQP
jgi:hypothetical protein